MPGYVYHMNPSAYMLKRFFQTLRRAIACLLFGGSKKILPDGMRLRGDINVLLLGDPGTAKSQLLKFVEKVNNIYTSKLEIPRNSEIHRLRQSLFIRRAKALVQLV